MLRHGNTDSRITVSEVDFDHAFSCDFDEQVKKTIEANFSPKIFFDDITTCDMASRPSVDIYIAGFPCQPFSSAGKRHGFEDERDRGTVYHHIYEYLDHEEEAEDGDT